MWGATWKIVSDSIHLVSENNVSSSTSLCQLMVFLTIVLLKHQQWNFCKVRLTAWFKQKCLQFWSFRHSWLLTCHHKNFHVDKLNAKRKDTKDMKKCFWSNQHGLLHGEGIRTRLPKWEKQQFLVMLTTETLQGWPDVNAFCSCRLHILCVFSIAPVANQTLPAEIDRQWMTPLCWQSFMLVDWIHCKLFPDEIWVVLSDTERTVHRQHATDNMQTVMSVTCKSAQLEIHQMCPLFSNWWFILCNIEGFSHLRWKTSPDGCLATTCAPGCIGKVLVKAPLALMCKFLWIVQNSQNHFWCRKCNRG